MFAELQVMRRQQRAHADLTQLGEGMGTLGRLITSLKLYDDQGSEHVVAGLSDRMTHEHCSSCCMGHTQGWPKGLPGGPVDTHS